MPDRTSTRRSDHELAEMLDEPRSWRLTGRRGVILGYADCLRDAMKAACETRTVIAVSRQPDGDVIVFEGQLRNLAGDGSERKRARLEKPAG
jgi:hypothetical protein